MNLNRLKMDAELKGNLAMSIFPNQLIAIIDRLEAAEENVNAAWEIEDILEVPKMFGETSSAVLQRAIDRFRDSHKAWCRVKGENDAEEGK